MMALEAGVLNCKLFLQVCSAMQKPMRGQRTAHSNTRFWVHVFSHIQKNIQDSPFKVLAWRIIPFSKWLVTMVSFRPLTGVVPLPNGLFMAYKWGLRGPEMILQSACFFLHSNFQDPHLDNIWQPMMPSNMLLPTCFQSVGFKPTEETLTTQFPGNQVSQHTQLGWVGFEKNKSISHLKTNMALENRNCQ